MAASEISVDISQAMSTQPVAAADWLIVAPLVITAMGGALCLMLRKNTRLQPVVGVAVLLLLVAACGALLARVIDHGVLTMVAGNWLPPFGIAFTVDPLGATLNRVAQVRQTRREASHPAPAHSHRWRAAGGVVGVRPVA